MTATSSNVIINFAWKGPASWGGPTEEGGCFVGIVDLKIKDAKTEVSVHIPHYDISADKIHKFAFHCIKYGDQTNVFHGQAFKNVLKESYPDLLKLKVEQVKNLTLKAGLFEESPRKGPLSMDTVTGKITQQTYVVRNDHAVKLTLPENLEIGQTYCLMIRSASAEFADLSATLVKQESPKAGGKQEGKE